jgi:hypothetical protein
LILETTSKGNLVKIPEPRHGIGEQSPQRQRKRARIRRFGPWQELSFLVK